MDEVREWFKFWLDNKTDELVFEFSDGTIKRAKRGKYMEDCAEGLAYQVGYARGLKERGKQ